jgi:polyhydroxyalkanoate synthesis regulator phasin
MKMANAAPGLKAKTDDVAEQLHDHVDHLVSEGALNSEQVEAHTEDIDELRRLIDEARELAMELRDDDFDLEEQRNRTTMDERFQAIGRAAYQHPDLMEEPLNELFQREPHLEPPVGRME